MGGRWTTLTFVGASLSCGAVAALQACRDPTELVVAVSTDVPCANLQGAAVTVGRLGDIETQPVTSTSSFCDTSGNLGSIVVVPGTTQAEPIGIKVVGGVDVPSEQCAPPKYTGCIVARRAIDFTSHTRLHVPVFLAQTCKDNSCDPQSTCYAGSCVPVSDVAPDGGLLDAGLPDAASEGGGTGTIASCGDGRGLSPTAQWPMEGFCNSNQWRVPYEGTRGSAVIRVNPPGARVNWLVGYAATIDDDGTIYFATGGPQLDGGPSGAFYALSPDGGVKWKAPYATFFAPFAPPTIAADGELYAPIRGTAVVELTRDSGAVANVMQIVGMADHGPSIGPDGTLYFASAGAGAYAFASGLQPKRWLAPLATNDVLTPLSLDGGTVLVATGGAVQLIVAADGGPAGVTSANGTEVVAAVVRGSDDGFYVAANDAKTGTVRSFDSTGRPRWSTPTTCPIDYLALELDDAVIVMQNQCGVEALDSATGNVRWQNARPVTVGPAVVDGLGFVYVADAELDGGKVWALDPGSGNAVWSLYVGISPHVLAMGRDGALIVGWQSQLVVIPM